MSGTGRVNAVLLAGDRRASIQVRNDNKAFLRLRGTPLLVHILQALRKAATVRDICIVGPAERIRQVLAEHADRLAGGGEIRVVEQRENMIENFKAGYVCALGLAESVDFASLRDSEHADTPALAVPCDIPLLTSWEVDQFVRRSNMEAYDYAIGITSEKILSHYHPHAEKPGIQMIYFHVREDLMRHNNLHLGKPLRFAHLDYIEKMYEWRYQTRLANVLRMTLSLLLVSWRFMTALRIFTLLQLSLYYDRHGRPRLADRIRMCAPLARLPEGIGKIIGARTQVVYTHFGGAALDVDHDENLDAMEAMYDEWMEHQLQLRNRTI